MHTPVTGSVWSTGAYIHHWQCMEYRCIYTPLAVYGVQVHIYTTGSVWSTGAYTTGSVWSTHAQDSHSLDTGCEKRVISKGIQQSVLYLITSRQITPHFCIRSCVVVRGTHMDVCTQHTRTHLHFNACLCPDDDLMTSPPVSDKHRVIERERVYFRITLVGHTE